MLCVFLVILCHVIALSLYSFNRATVEYCEMADLIYANLSAPPPIYFYVMCLSVTL